MLTPPSESQETISSLMKVLQDYDQRLQNTRYRWWGWPLAGFLCMIFFAYAGIVLKPAKGPNDEEHDLFIGAIAICGLILGATAYGLMVFLIRRGLLNARHQTEILITKANAERLKESIEEDFFTKLVKINFRYIDQYYYQTQEQANKSFRLSCAAAAVAFVIVILGIAMMFFGKTNPAYLTTAVGTVGQFFSAVFFYLYNKTILKMSEYHEKLVLTQNISVALKITQDLPPDAKVQSQQKLIDRLTDDVNRYLAERKPEKEASPS